MKKLLYVLMAVCSLLLTAVSCSEDNQLDTDQYQGGVSLNVFGPSPVARGGQIRFVGSGLNQITSVVFPGNVEVTDITVIDEKSIMVTVPKDGPEVGKIELKYPGGSLFTSSDITYTEPISLDSFSPAKVKAGDLLTLEGDYLNLMNAVVFAVGDTIYEDQFQEHTRYKISLYVPAEAQTGKVAVSDGEQVVESDGNLVVTLPAVSEIVDLSGKKPGDSITIAGTDFDLITLLTVADEETEFSVNGEGTEVYFALPENTPDSAAIAVYPASGVEVIIAYIGMQMPTDAIVTPATGLRSGDKITVTGNNLDVVSSVVFPNVEAAVAPEEQSATSFVVTVPEGTQSGDLVLVCKSGATQTLAIETAKPELTAYNPTPVAAGSSLTITGKNLDLISSVTFAEDCVVTGFTSQSESELVLTVPVTAVTGVLNIAMGNGETVEFTSLDVNSPVFCFIPEMPGDDAELKAGQMFTVTVVNADKLTGVQIDGIDCQYILVDDQLNIGIPDNAGYSSKLRLISSNGEVTYDLSIIPNTEQTFVIWTGALDLAGWSFNWQFGDNTHSTGESATAFADMGLQEGDVIRIWATNYNDWWQVQFFDGHWGAQTEIGTATGLNNGNNINSGIYDLSVGYIEIPVTATLAEQLTTLNDWGYCWIMQGEGIIINKIDVKRTISLETTLWSGEADLGTWSVNWQIGDGTFGAANPNMFVEQGLKAGQTIRIYATAKSDWWQIQFFDGHWGGQAEIGTATGLGNGNNINSGIYNLDENNGAFVIPVTETLAEQLTTLNDWGYCWIIQGENLILTKITVE
jgi:hypothetical protein